MGTTSGPDAPTLAPGGRHDGSQPDVTWTGYGPVGYDALRGLVATLKRDDPLAPVTVLVPTHLAGVVARRVLAGGGRGRAGVAALTVLTVDRLAEQLATPALVGSGRRPVTDAVLAAAWRRSLDTDPGVFAPVATHPATVQALVGAHRELREVDPHGCAAIVEHGGAVAADVVRLHRRVLGLLADDWYDQSDLRTTATRAVADRPRAAAELGTVLLFLPQDLPAGAAGLLGRLATHGDLRVIAAATGQQRADATVLRSLRRLRPALQPPAPVGQPRADLVLHASDADDEVRCVVRRLIAALRDVPAHRVAVLYGTARPYARLFSEHLAAAGIAWNGAGVRPTLERTVARVLLDVLALPQRDWRRDEVLAALCAAPVRDAGGQRVPAARWERISRAAGVVGGDDWDLRLKGYAAHQRLGAATERAAEAPRADVVAGRERDADGADALLGFVTDLRARLHEGASLSTWPALAAWGQETFEAVVGELGEERRLPEDEARAAEKITRLLAGLAGLGPVEAGADLVALQGALRLGLADDLPRHGRFGTGVLVSPLSGAIGLDADLVFVVGLAEDLVPGRLGADALLPDRVRALAAGQLPPLRERTDRQHRHLLAALAAAPTVVVSFPRGDLRRSSSRLPSRWLLPALRELSGSSTLDATGWDTVPGDFLIGSPSYAASLTSTGELATEQEWRTRAAAAAHRAGGAGRAALPADRVVAAATDLRVGRAGDPLSRFDGDLSGHRLPDPAGGVVFSPTALEAWARCPHGYFISRMLGITPIDPPEELVQISPLEVGNLFHTALDRFFAGQATAGAVPGGSTLWTVEQRAELRRIASAVADDLAARGVTGHRLLWQHELTRILAELELFLDDDEQLRARTGRRQERSELTFGMRGAPPVPVQLPDGRQVWLRGSADRVDRAGDAIVVVDYKTGNPKSFDGLSPDDPTAGGSKLQLPVYGYAARAALGESAGEVSAEYWFLRRERGKRVTLPLTEPVQRAYASAVAVIADGIAAGLFPHRPPADDGWGSHVGCAYCDPDQLGAGEHRDRWARKRHDPRLAAYLALVEPDVAR